MDHFLFHDFLDVQLVANPGFSVSSPIPCVYPRPSPYDEQNLYYQIRISNDESHGSIT